MTCGMARPSIFQSIYGAILFYRTDHAHAKVSRRSAQHHKSSVRQVYRFDGLTENKAGNPMAFDPSSLFGIDCLRYGNDLIAPENTEYLDYQLIRHVWHCPKCHARFES